jgi:hypothetical protein
MARGYKILPLTGSHLQVAVDLYDLLIKYNGKKDFTIGPFLGGGSVLMKTEFKKNDLVRVAGDLLTVPFILNLYETSAVLMTDHNVNQIGLFYDILNVFRSKNINVEIKVIELTDSIVEEWKNNYVASTDELIAAAGKCLKDVETVFKSVGKEFKGFTSEDLRMKIFLENTPNKYAKKIIKCVKDLYDGSNYRVCFCSDVHEYLALVYCDVGVYHHKSVGFNRCDKMYRILYKNIVKKLNKDADAPIEINL